MSNDRRLDPQRLRTLARRMFAATGSSEEEAGIVADHLVEANLKGHDSHGVIRVAKYVSWMRAGHLASNRHAEVVSDLGALVVADGGFGYGQVIGREVMEIAADRAKRHGICAAAIRNAGHLGRIGAWAEQLAGHGLVSVHFVNTSGFGILASRLGAQRPGPIA